MPKIAIKAIGRDNKTAAAKHIGKTTYTASIDTEKFLNFERSEATADRNTTGKIGIYTTANKNIRKVGGIYKTEF